MSPKPTLRLPVCSSPLIDKAAQRFWIANASPNPKWVISTQRPTLKKSLGTNGKTRAKR